MTIIATSTITNEEKVEIEHVYRRKLALENIAKMAIGNNSNDELSLNSEALDRVKDELGEVLLDMEKWWHRISDRNNWEYGEGYSWGVNYDANIVFVAKQ